MAVGGHKIPQERGFLGCDRKREPFGEQFLEANPVILTAYTFV